MLSGLSGGYCVNRRFLTKISEAYIRAGGTLDPPWGYAHTGIFVLCPAYLCLMQILWTAWDGIAPNNAAFNWLNTVCLLIMRRNSIVLCRCVAICGATISVAYVVNKHS